MSELTPREIVAELDKYIIGQNQAKRMVAIAVRNRWRRQRLAAELRNEVAPRNIIMMARSPFSPRQAVLGSVHQG